VQGPCDDQAAVPNNSEKLFPWTVLLSEVWKWEEEGALPSPPWAEGRKGLAGKRRWNS